MGLHLEMILCMKWSVFLQPVTYTVKGIPCHSNRSPQLFELKKKQQNQVTLFKIFFVMFLIVVVTHNTFTQLNIPTQDLPSWFV